MRSKVVVGNWKLNGSLAGNEALLKALLRGDSARQPAWPARSACRARTWPRSRALLEGSGIAWGAQDVSRFDKGAYTGEVSGAMLVEFGCRYALVGHSERRTLFGETDAIVAEKYVAARKAGLTPIFCVGETLAEREARRDRGGARAAGGRAAGGPRRGGAGRRRSSPTSRCGPSAPGKTATAAQASEAHAFIRASRGARRMRRWRDASRSSTGAA